MLLGRYRPRASLIPAGRSPQCTRLRRLQKTMARQLPRHQLRRASSSSDRRGAFAQKLTLLLQGGLVRYQCMQEKPLEIERVNDADVASVIFRLHGPLLLGNFFSFQSMVRSDQSNLLIVDMADVPYIDSAGIGCLVGAHVSRVHAGRKLIIAGATERLLNMLKATKVDQLFAFAATVDEARAKS